MNIFTKKKRKENGFTLIELIIVVAIIGFLMAIAIPRYATSRLRAAQSATKANLHQLATALEVHYTETVPTGYPANATEAGTVLQNYIPKAPKVPGGGGYYLYTGGGNTYTIWDPVTSTEGEGTGVYQIGPGGVITVGSAPSGGAPLNWGW